MPDSWLADYSSCTQLSQDVVELINERNTDARLGANVTSINILIKKDLLNLKRMVEKLKRGLHSSAKTNAATYGEVQRRQNLLDTLATKVRILSEATDSGRLLSNSEINVSKRGDLLSIQHHGETSTSNQWLESEERIAALDAEEFRSKCDDVIKDQNEGLNKLSETIDRQKKIGIRVGNEADLQKNIIDDIHTQLEDTNEQMQGRITQIVDVQKTNSTSTCVMWLIVSALAVAIVIVAIT